MYVSVGRSGKHNAVREAELAWCPPAYPIFKATWLSQSKASYKSYYALRWLLYVIELFLPKVLLYLRIHHGKSRIENLWKT